MDGDEALRMRREGISGQREREGRVRSGQEPGGCRLAAGGKTRGHWH